MTVASTQTTMRLLLKGIQFLLGAFALYSFYAMMYWREYYTRHLPQTIEPREGRIIPLQLNHDIIVYGTLLERQKLEDTLHLAYIGVGVILLAALLQLFAKCKNRKN